MSTEVRKRGRPRKVVEEVPSLAAEQIPKPTSRISKVTRPSTTKVTTSTTKASSKSNASEKQANGKRKKAESVITIEGDLGVSNDPATPVIEEIPPPPAVARLVAIEESKILKEVARTAAKPKKTTPPKAEAPVIEETAAQEVLPPSEARPPPLAAHLQPTNTLAMGLPIPTYQATTHTLGLQASKCLPWLPNPSNLTQAAYLSSTTPMHAAKRKLGSQLKEANRFVVAEQSSRGGPGSGAAASRAAAEEGRPGLIMPGEMPAKYKPAMRRVQAIIVALPIVIVTSWMLYERCECTHPPDVATT
jgi:hypothetical protein